MDEKYPFDVRNIFIAVILIYRERETIFARIDLKIFYML